MNELQIGKPQKKSFFSGQSTKRRREEGLRGCLLRKKELFFVAVEKIKYILFKTTYPNIKITVLVYCVLSIGKLTGLTGCLKILLF